VVAESINAGPLTGGGTITESGETLKQATIHLSPSPAPTFYRLAAGLTTVP
jgi:hypothetical protein